MSISALPAIPVASPAASNAARSQGAVTGSGFFNLLETLENGESPSPAAAHSSVLPPAFPATRNQLAAADLLRVEMMQSALSLDGQENSSPSATSALESMLGSLAGGSRPGSLTTGTNHPLDGRQPAIDDTAGTAASLPQEAGGGVVDGIGRTAAGFLGIPYRFGGEGANGIDCSSFVQQVFREHQIELPRTAREQSRVGSDVAQGDLRKGDLVFFHTYASYPSHVGIYLGDGKMIHASSVKGEVTVSDINSNYYRSRFIGAKRLA